MLWRPSNKQTFVKERNMYLNHWNLSAPPFENISNPAFFYPSSMHKEALERLSYAVFQGKGAAMIVGGVGIGKTMVCRALVRKLSRERYRIATMNNPALEPIDFLTMVARLFKVPNGCGRSKCDIWQALEIQLHANVRESNGSVLVIDEAQVIQNHRTLDEIRMLLNLQSDEQFLVNVILVGHLELEKLVVGMTSLDQRITIRHRLLHLQYKDFLYYVKHRLQVAGCMNVPFSLEALEAVYRYTEGVPRKINNLCDRSMLAAYLKNKTTISSHIVEEAWKDLQ